MYHFSPFIINKSNFKDLLNEIFNGLIITYAILNLEREKQRKILIAMTLIIDIYRLQKLRYMLLSL